MANHNVEKFIAAAMTYKGDAYSQKDRMKPKKSDCSSLIQKAGSDIGLWDRKDIVTTHRMGVEGDPRFVRIDKSAMQRGDILWGGNYINSKWEGHVAIYLGDGKTLEARVREGVDYNKDRPYFTRVYRIKALYDVPVQTPTVIQNVEIYIHGNLVPSRGYIVEGVTYLEVNGSTIAVRKFFEGLKMKVEWKNGKVYIS